METRKEFRFLEQPELRASAGNILEGHAAVFNQWSRNLGGFREKILPGAFARSIREDNVVALWSHDQHSIPLARNKSGSLELSEDSVGLKTVIHLPDTSFAKDIYTSLKRGDIASMSFAFLTKKDAWAAGGSERT
jgi:HK97 family phage prohead protease